MNGLLNNKCCLIVGASQGIGAAIVEEFITQGARLVIASRNLDKLEAVAQPFREKGHEIHTLKMDISEPEQIIQGIAYTTKQLGRLDIAINNAAIQSPHTLFADFSQTEYERIQNTNLRGVFLSMQEEIKAMLSIGGGSIVNISSLGGLIGFPKMAPYLASKHGVTGLTKAAALDHAKQNIRVNAVAPGGVMTEMVANGTGNSPEAVKMIEAKIPIGRMGEPIEIAKAACWLASDSASYVTGATLPVDGGYSIP